MSDADLIAFWRAAELNGPPYIHPQDRPFFERHRPNDLYHPPLGPDGYRLDKAAHDLLFTHLSLFPSPYFGDLRRSDVFILMLNPGFSETEYVVEAAPEVSIALRRSLTQQFEAEEYPFWYLDPRFAKHPGHGYWVSHLRGLGPPMQLSRRIAVIQRFPYHSTKFGHSAVADRLPSSIHAKRYVRETILPRVLRDEATLIVARGATAFGFTKSEERPNLVVYGAGETLGAQLTSRTRGGAAILSWFEKHPTNPLTSNSV